MRKPTTFDEQWAWMLEGMESPEEVLWELRRVVCGMTLSPHYWRRLCRAYWEIEECDSGGWRDLYDTLTEMQGASNDQQDNGQKSGQVG